MEPQAQHRRRHASWRRRRVAVALAVAAGLSGVGIGSGVVAASTPPADSDVVALLDDLGVLAVVVPASWTDVDTAPGTNDNGTVMPWISASTDYDAYSVGFDVPGVVLAAVTYTDDLQSWVDQLGTPNACDGASSQPYTAGVLTGLEAHFTGCGPSGDAELWAIAANADGSSDYTYLIQVQVPTRAEVATIEAVVDSVVVVDVTGPLPDGVTTTTTVAASLPATTSPPGEAPDESGEESAEPGESASEAMPPTQAPSGSVVVTLPDGTPLAPALPPGMTTTTTVATVTTPTTTSPLVTTVPGTTEPPVGATTTTTTTTATTTTTPASTDASAAPFTPTNVVAEGARRLIDDTRSISLSVPPLWIHSVTRPLLGTAWGDLPQIVASTNLALFEAGSYTVPGVRYVARPFVADTADAVAALGRTLDCRPGVVQEYLDPVFSGHIQQLTDCAGSATRAYALVASPSNQQMTASIVVIVPGIDDADLQTVLSTFNVDPAVAIPGSSGTVAPTTVTTTETTTVAPISTVPPASTIPVLSVPETTVAPSGSAVLDEVFTPSPDYPDESIFVTDDTGLLTLAVPPTWTDQFSTVVDGADGRQWPLIAVSTDLDEFVPPEGQPDPFTAPGVIYSVEEYTPDTEGRLAALGDGTPCTAGPVQPYRDPVFTGHIQQFTACGGTSTRLVSIVANPSEGGFTVVLTVQLTDDPTALNTVLATFNYDAAVASTLLAPPAV